MNTSPCRAGPHFRRRGIINIFTGVTMSIALNGFYVSRGERACGFLTEF